MAEKWQWATKDEVEPKKINDELWLKHLISTPGWDFVVTIKLD